MHDRNSSIYADIDERFEALGRHQVNYQIVSLRLDEVEITRPSKVAGKGVRDCSCLVGRHDIVTTHS